MPNFVKHNLATSDFTIDYLEDLNLVSEYVVTIRSEICVPVDYFGKNCTKMTDEYNFSIFIDPC